MYLTILAGPTGVGKSQRALEWAQEHHAEIVSADSGQVYQGFDIGAAKPSQEEQAQVPHHCIDLFAPDVRGDAVLWQRAADTAIADIQQRGKNVLVVGGTGFYLRALLHGLFESPDPDPEIRRVLKEQWRQRGGELLHQRLQQVDPQAAARIHATDEIRVVRALEYYEQTGRPISQAQEAHKFKEERYPYKLFVLNRPREELYQRINQRTEQMFQQGWLEEAEALYDQWGGDVPAFQLIGYREIVLYIRGELSKVQLIPQIQQASRRYAKRQLTWFRKLKELTWIS